MDWYVRALKKYAEFTGRARRTEFWMFAIYNALFSILAVVMERILHIPGVLGFLYGAAVLIPSLAVSVRRLHDTGRSGWWLLLGLVPLVGAIVLIVFALQDSQPGANPYGPNPKETPAQPAGAA